MGTRQDQAMPSGAGFGGPSGGANCDTAVGDKGTVPACPALGVVAPMLEEDVVHAGR